MPDTAILKERFPIRSMDFTTAGEASGKIKSILKKLGVSGDVLRRVAVSAYEAEINLVIHTLGGELVLEVTPKAVKITSSDVGPGIENIELAMKAGYSTAPESVRMMGFGAGMGLPNMKRCSDEFEIQSTPKVGTTLSMKFNL